MNKRLFVVFCLGFSSGLPTALISSTLQAWFADKGMSILFTGTLSLIGLPYAYRFFWGPILDRYSLFNIGKRRSWIFSMQFLLLIGFNLLAWFTPEHHPKLMAAVAFILAFFSATQDLAIDAHRTEYLPKKQHALGASLAVFGYRLALLFSGGLALVMAQNLGWAFTYRIIGLLMMVGMFAVFLSEEPSFGANEKIKVSQLFIETAKDLLKRPGIIYLMCFIFCYKFGEAFTTSTSGVVIPFLIQGMGFSLETIGYVNKMMGIASILLGGLTAGFILTRYSLYPTLFLFGIAQALTNGLFVVLALVGKNVLLLSLAVFFDNFSAGMGSTALVALFMRLVNKQFTGTQFSIFVALSTVPRIISGPLAAFIQMAVGWVGLYQLSVVFALLFIPFLILIKDQVGTNEAEFASRENEASLNPISVSEY
jgi:PAT family beta-lactamase induction signal transducer AmpG